MNMVFVMLAHVTVAEHISRCGELLPRDMGLTKGNITLNTNQQQLPCLFMNEAVPALSCLENGGCHSAICVQIDE